MPPQDMHTTLESPAEHPRTAANQPTTTSMLERLKMEIRELPVSPQQVVLPAEVQGRQLNETQLRQIMVQQYRELDARINTAFETGELTADDAAHMRRALEQREQELAVDPGYQNSGMQFTIGGMINRVEAWRQQKATEGTPLGNAVQGALGGGAATAAFSALSAGIARLGASGGIATAGGIVGGGLLAIASPAVANYLHQKLGIKPAITHGVMQAGTIGAALAIAPASWPIIVGSAALGLIGMLVSRIVSKSRQEEAKRQPAPAAA